MDRIAFKSPAPISLADIADQAERAVAMMAQIRTAMLAPTARKLPPIFNLSQLAALCGIEKGSLSHRLGKSDLPAGKLNESGSRREFSLEEARAWIREYRKEWLRPPGAEAVTISIGNFKGGVSKTTTAVNLAESLAHNGAKVLVVEDEPALARLVSDTLTSAGLTVDIAGDGQEALARVRRATYDAVVCDLKIPKVDGRTLYRAITATTPALARRVIFVTADGAGTDAARFLEETGCRWLATPFRPEDVVRAVRAALA